MGKHLVEELLLSHMDVTILCRNKPKNWTPNSVKFILGDITNKETVDYAMTGVEYVFHLASKAGIWGAYHTYYKPNVIGTNNVIQACKKHRVSKLIYTSSPSIVLSKKSVKNGTEELKTPLSFFNNYQKTKSIAEKIIIEANTSSLQTVSIRPQAIWGHGDVHIFPRILKKLKRKTLKIVGNGKNKISVAYVKNVAWAHLQAALTHGIGGNVYFINDEKPVNPWTWIEENTKELGYSMPTKKVPQRIAFYLSSIIETIYKTANISSEPPFTRYMVCEIANDHYYSIEKAKRDFGYYEKYDLDEGKKEFKKYLSKINKII